MVSDWLERVAASESGKLLVLVFFFFGLQLIAKRREKSYVFLFFKRQGREIKNSAADIDSSEVKFMGQRDGRRVNSDMQGFFCSYVCIVYILGSV